MLELCCKTMYLSTFHNGSLIIFSVYYPEGRFPQVSWEFSLLLLLPLVQSPKSLFLKLT